MGYMAGIQPIGEWRFFSWHPFLMTAGMVGMAGIGAVTKKMGGYDNTKVGLGMDEYDEGPAELFRKIPDRCWNSHD